MDQEKKHAIALMRYSVIAPLITGLSDNYSSLTAFFYDASAKGVLHPSVAKGINPSKSSNSST